MAGGCLSIPGHRVSLLAMLVETAAETQSTQLLSVYGMCDQHHSTATVGLNGTSSQCWHVALLPPSFPALRAEGVVYRGTLG